MKIFIKITDELPDEPGSYFVCSHMTGLGVLKWEGTPTVLWAGVTWWLMEVDRGVV